jgi:hypothetical protein
MSHQYQAPIEEKSLLEELDDLILGFGKTVYIYQHSLSSTNVYGQEALSFATTSIKCTGRVILNPTSEQISIVGDRQDVDVGVVFARKEMLRKFPSATENYWIDEKDEFEFENERFRILKAHATGRIKSYNQLLVLLGASKKGQFRT